MYLYPGKLKAIGVSNYTLAHMEDLLSYCTVKPAVLQVIMNLKLSFWGGASYQVASFHFDTIPALNIRNVFVDWMRSYVCKLRNREWVEMILCMNM